MKSRKENSPRTRLHAIEHAHRPLSDAHSADVVPPPRNPPRGPQNRPQSANSSACRAIYPTDPAATRPPATSPAPASKERRHPTAPQSGPPAPLLPNPPGDKSGPRKRPACRAIYPACLAPPRPPTRPAAQPPRHPAACPPRYHAAVPRPPTKRAPPQLRGRPSDKSDKDLTDREPVRD